MLGLKSFQTAGVVIAGIELAEKIKKKQLRPASSAEPRQLPRRSGEPPWRHSWNNPFTQMGVIRQPAKFAPEPFTPMVMAR
jgi:hypothetical protein